MSGVVKGRSPPAAQTSKISTLVTPLSRSAANADGENTAQPMQQVQQAAVPNAVEYKQNSMAIKMSNNPLATLTGLQEAAASVLDDPVSMPGSMAEFTKQSLVLPCSGTANCCLADLQANSKPRKHAMNCNWCSGGTAMARLVTMQVDQYPRGADQVSQAADAVSACQPDYQAD